MRETEREHTPSAGAVEELRRLTTTPNPDARLIAACASHIVLTTEIRRLFTELPHGYADKVRAFNAERLAVEAEIAKSAALTPAGRSTKALVALAVLNGYGMAMAVPRSALLDFINAQAGEVVL